MTQQQEDTIIHTVLAIINKNGLDGIKVSMRKKVVNDIRSIFNAPNLPEAERLLEMSIKKYQTTASNLSPWMESNIPEGLTVFSLPENQENLHYQCGLGWEITESLC